VGLIFVLFSVAYKHINGKFVITLYLAQTWLTIICEQHACTCLYFWENIVYAWKKKTRKLKDSEIRPQNTY